MTHDIPSQQVEAERARHVTTLRYLSSQYLPGGPRDIKGALRAAIEALSASSPSSEQGRG